MGERPIKKPTLQYAHERLGNLRAEEITERIPTFTETDGGKRPDLPTSFVITALDKTYEEYSKELAPYFKMKLVDGVLEVRMHTNGGAAIWCVAIHDALHKLFTYVNNDRDVELMIFGGSGEDFIGDIGAPACYRDTTKEIPPMPEGDSAYNWQLFERQYFDGTSDIETQVNLSIPTIGIWHGGSFHSDLFLLCDITLASEDAYTTDQHFRGNMVPGDGVQIVWRELMGQKRFAYAELTGEIITARKALKLGMINEIHEDLEACYARAWEIADLIMHSGTRTTRRLTVQALRKEWKEKVANELRGSFATEMWNTLAEGSPHSPLYWQCSKAEGLAYREAEKKGKVVRPRIGKFIEEDIIE